MSTQQTIVAILDKDVYILNLDGGYLYEIDGNVVDLSNKNNSKYVITSKTCNKISQYRHISVISYYISCESDVLSVDDYETNITLLKSKYNDEVWQSLEDEFNYRKFIARWIPVNQTVKCYIQDYNVQIDKAIESTKYITPIRCVGGDLASTHAFYNRKQRILDDVIVILQKFKFQDEDQGTKSISPTKLYKLYHYNVDITLYLKKPDKKFEWKQPEVYKGSYEEITKTWDYDTARIKELEDYLSLIGTEVPDMAKIIAEFENVYRYLDDVVPIKRSEKDLRLFKQKMNEFKSFLLGTVNVQ